MKKVFFIALAIFAANYLQAQTTTADPTKKQLRKENKADNKDIRQLKRDIRATSKAGFARDFASITAVSWSTDSVFDVADFTTQGKDMEVYYDESGTLVGTLTFISFNTLPEKSKKEIKKEYKNYTVKKTISYDDNENNSNEIFLYGTEFNNDTYFVEISDGTNDVMLLVTLTGDVTSLETL